MKREISIMVGTDESRKKQLEKLLGVSLEHEPGGDFKSTWDSEREADVKHAKETFDRLLADKFSIFRVKKDGGQGEKMKTFDPEAEAMIAVPQISGG